MPERLPIIDRHQDPYAWALAQSTLLRRVALSRNPDGHWRSECIEFHDSLVDAYRPSMREKIEMASLWRRACRKAYASFADRGEPKPRLPAACPFTVDQLIALDLDLDRLVATITPE